jgi:hypothetical protein
VELVRRVPIGGNGHGFDTPSFRAGRNPG